MKFAITATAIVMLASVVAVSAAPLGTQSKSAIKPAVDEYHHATKVNAPLPRSRPVNAPKVTDPDWHVRHNNLINQANQ